MRTHTWEYWESSEAIEFCFKYAEWTFPSDRRLPLCRGFMSVSIKDVDVHANDHLQFLFLCLACRTCDVQAEDYYPLQDQQASTDLREQNYYRFQETRFATCLRSRYPAISDADASKVTEVFMGILRIANPTHVCPESTTSDTACLTSHFINLKIQPRGRLCHTPLESSDVFTDAAANPTIPATTASILELFKAPKSTIEGGAQCPICMDGMETRSMLRMPCSHSFHCACLLHWLNRSHFCPLCRYEMPAAQNRSNLRP